MREEGADIVIALSHSGIDAAATGPMLENAALSSPPCDGIDAIVTGHQHRVWPSAKTSRATALDPATGAHRRRARGDGRLLGLAHGPHRPPARAGRRRLARRLLRDQRPPDLQAQRGPQRHRRSSSDYAPPLAATDRRPRGDARLRPRRGRHLDRAAPVLLRARRRRPLGADRQPGADLVRRRSLLKGTEHEGLPILSAAAPVQVRRPRRPRLLHRRPRRPDRHQERRRRLPLPQHPPGRRRHRRPGPRVARALGRHLQPHHPRRRRPAADRPRLPRLQLRLRSTASPTRSTSPSPRATTATASS